MTSAHDVQAPVQRSSTPAVTSAASSPSTPIQRARAKAGEGADAQQKELTPPPPPPSGNGAIQRKQDEASPVVQRAGGGRAIQRDQKGGTKVTVASTVAFDLGLAIPIYGPIKLEGKVAGSYSQSQTPDGPKTEVEGTLYGGVLVDLMILKLRAGIEGKVKFTVRQHTDVMTAIKKGINEITNWELAKDFVPKLQQKKGVISTIYGARLEGITRNTSKLMQEAKKGNWKDAAARNGWFYTNVLAELTPRQWIDWYLGDLAERITETFSDLGATVDKNKLVNHAGAEAKLNDIGKAVSYEDAIQKIIAMQAYVVGEFQRSEGAIKGAIDQVQCVKNEPSVGFTASVAFKAGASVQATQNLSGEVEVALTKTIEDKDGEKAWNTAAVSSQVVTGKVVAGGWEVSLVGDFKPTEVEITGGYTKKSSTATPQVAEQSVGTVMSAVKGAKTAFQMAASPIATGKAIVGKVGELITANAKQMADPAEIAKRAKLNPALEQAVAVEVKLKFKRTPFSLIGGGVKVTLTEAKLSAEKYLGKSAAVGVTGSISKGTSFEAAWGE